MQQAGGVGRGSDGEVFVTWFSALGCGCAIQQKRVVELGLPPLRIHRRPIVNLCINLDECCILNHKLLTFPSVPSLPHTPALAECPVESNLS